MIVGIAGTFAAGKGAVVDYLKTKGFVQYSISKLLGELVEKEGNPKTRDFLGPMATKLQQEYSGGVVEKAYTEKYLFEKPENAIFESLHRLSEAHFIKRIGGVLIGVDADLMTRYQRTQTRKEGAKDDVTLEQFKELMRVEEEGGGHAAWDNNIRAVINEADVVIQNNGTLEELYQQVDAALAQVTK